jgi:nucleotide-binding universal stress UspA family protein
VTTTVLLAVGDPVEASRSVGRVVERRGREPGCEVVVLHVHETVHGALFSYVLDQEAPGECLAEIVTRTLAAQGITARPMIVERPAGSVPSAIADAALQVGAAVVVVGAVSGWCRPQLATAARVGRLLPTTVTLQTVT